MMLHKLKVAALQHEQREEWESAIALYRQAIRESDGGAEGGDPSIYNRIGDLAIKAGDASAACEAWEQGVTRYADLGFLNSAIALCGKILRVNPQRLHTYLELARMHARKRVLYDVRYNLRIYLDQMTAAGRLADARTAADRLDDEFPGWPELTGLIDEMLGRERLPAAPPPGAPERRPGAGGLVFLDTAPMQIERASEPVGIGPSDQPDAVVSEPDHGATAHHPPLVETAETVHPGEVSPLAGFESTSTHAASDQTPPVPLLGLVGTESVRASDHSHAPVDGLESGHGVGEPVEVTSSGPADKLAQRDIDPEQESASQDLGGDLIFLQTESADTPSEVAPDEVGIAAPDVDRDSALPDVAVDDALGQRVAAEGLLAHGDRVGAVTALERSLASYQEQGEWLHAFQAATELVQADPGVINRHQARVEVASKLRDVVRLCEAYADLGDALMRVGSEDKAVAVYRRVLELDEHHVRARSALRAMSPETADPSESGFIDLGAMLIDDHPRSTRMRTEMPDVAPDENDTFRDALAEFKRALDQNLPVEDHQAHYDLGIAFKEMGLLDESVSEFQKALRSVEGRLRTSEALGEVFFDQNRPAVAEAVLRSAEGGSEPDSDKIGVLYWLGRSLDAQGRHADAMSYYQRVIAVDVAFRDVTERLSPPPGNPA
jgi:tetratricopeptide (TPR) repeat protein